MKYLIILFSIMFFSITTNAQKQDVVCLPSKVAKQMAKDLIIGDSAKAILTIVSEELKTLKQKVDYQDILLKECDQFRSNAEQLTANERAQKNNYSNLYENCKIEFTTLSKKQKKEKVKSRFINILGSAAIVALSILYLTK